MTENDLKSCPFCGGRDNNLTIDSGDLQKWYVWCWVCEATGPDGDDEKDAAEMWNKRCTEDRKEK